MRAEHHRRSIRLRETDYSVPGFYFITICVKNRSCLFGGISDGVLKLNELGNIAKRCWGDIPNHYQNVIVDEYIIMPNHIHGILLITDQNNTGVQNIEPLRQSSNGNVGAQYFVPTTPGLNQFQHTVSGSIGAIIRGFKIGVTKWWRENGYEGGLWQRNYYEHIIRNEKSLNQIRQYIHDNPFNWSIDENNPACCAPNKRAV